MHPYLIWRESPFPWTLRIEASASANRNIFVLVPLDKFAPLGRHMVIEAPGPTCSGWLFGLRVGASFAATTGAAARTVARARPCCHFWFGAVLWRRFWQQTLEHGSQQVDFAKKKAVTEILKQLTQAACLENHMFSASLSWAHGCEGHVHQQ